MNHSVLTIETRTPNRLHVKLHRPTTLNYFFLLAGVARIRPCIDQSGRRSPDCIVMKTSAARAAGDAILSELLVPAS